MQQCRNISVHALTAEEKLVRPAAHTVRRLGPMDRRQKAVCRDEDPELFFPVGNSGPALAQIADAKLVCNRFSVTTECLSWPLNTGQDSGVWGGMSEDERRALKRRHARTKARSGV